MKYDLTEIKTFAKHYLDGDTTGHDYFHVERVANLAVQMYRKDHSAQDQHAELIMQLAGYLHDTIDEKITNNIEQRLAEIKDLQIINDLNTLDRKNVLDIIQNMSFSKNIEKHYQLSIEGQYVQDADRIEALGAIGIARAFAYGGKHDHPIYDPRIPVTKLTSHNQYRKIKETSINHFYEKLFTLENLMNTPSGQQLAYQRTRYMKTFVEEFLNEWNIKK